MNMPGFTAEESLYKPSKSYCMSGTVGAPQDGKRVFPQITMPLLCQICPECCGIVD